MYLPPHFVAQDTTVQRILATFGAADLVTFRDGCFDATTIPMVFHPELGPRGALRGHVSRDNLQWQHHGTALVIIRGVDGYISPSFYPSKQAHGKVAPTWSYETLNIHGELAAVDDAAWLHAHLHALTDKFEANEASPWSVDDTPHGYVDQRLPQIVGLEFTISRIDAKAKLSQNKPLKDVTGVIDGLDARGDVTLRDATREANANRLR